ncbi:hypothetical protein OE88DRAFT_1711888 [Heliocybe sulcata]|uniref:Uncharacterized protein n=1 Tax=Heliocybe sulcata TaxID=5364 RepID=A0A5C3N814_9AGAM|nr:hypothetical protein OE88DRAFT_1711888 [Heliocybe sulcata]
MGMQKVEWDGISPKVVADPEMDGPVLIVLAGQPKDQSWREVPAGVFEAMEKEREQIRGGQKAPGNLALPVANLAAISRLLDNTYIQQLVQFTNLAFDLFTSMLCCYYGSMLSELCCSDNRLEQHFCNSVFACVTFNFGPMVRFYIHTDHLNLVVTSCWDLKLVIKFPPRSTIFILSAILRHSNVPVRPGEKQLSFVQWSAGGLFRWVEFGMQSAKLYQEKVRKISETVSP